MRSPALSMESNRPDSPQSALFSGSFAESQTLVEAELGTQEHRGRRPELKRSVFQYRGYDKVAAYRGSEPSLLICRKFGSLHNRILLHLQDELANLEDQLRSLDKWTAVAVDPTNFPSRRLEDSGSERSLLLSQCSDKLAHYDNTLLRLHKKEAVPKPSKRNQNSLCELIFASEGIPQIGYQWICQTDDLLALAHNADYDSFSDSLALSLDTLLHKLTPAVFRTRQQTGYRTLRSTKRFNVLVRSIVTLFAILLVLTPIYILWELQPTSQVKRAQPLQLLCILLFTLAFHAYWSMVTKAQRQELVGATAAYCAVLLVVLSNSPTMPS